MIKDDTKVLWSTQKSQDPIITKDALFKYFSEYGPVLSIQTVEHSKVQIICKIELKEKLTEEEICKIPIHLIQGTYIIVSNTNPINIEPINDKIKPVSVILFEQISIKEWCQHTFRAFASSFGQVNKYWFDIDPNNPQFYIGTIEYDGIVKAEDLSNDPEIIKRMLKVSNFDGTKEGPQSPNLIEAEFHHAGSTTKNVAATQKKPKNNVQRSRKRFFAQNLKGLNLLEFEDKENIQQLKAAALKNIKVNIYHYYSNLRFNSFKPKCKKNKKNSEKQIEEKEKIQS